MHSCCCEHCHSRLPLNLDSVAVDDYSNNMQPNAPWTLDELSSRVAAVTQQLGLLQSNGQIADAPNARAIRWYQSTGLVSRPQQRGRTAFYDVQHLLQLVAIKRLQASGKTLEDIQQELLGKDDEAIRLLAALPAEIDLVGVVAPAPVIEARSFWSADVAAVDLTPVVVEPVVPHHPTRLAFDHPLGVTLVFPSARSPTRDDVQAILSAVVNQLTARGLLAVTVPAPNQQKEKP